MSAAADISKPDPAEERRLGAAADRVRVEVDELSQSGSEPALFSGRLRVDGMPLDVRVEFYYGLGRMTAFRWLHGSNPQILSSAQTYAVRRMLVDRARAASRES